MKRSPCLLVGGNCSIFSKVNILEARGEPTMENNLVIISCPLADPDLQIRGGGRVGCGHLDPEIRGARSQKKFFSALRASVWPNVFVFAEKGL